MIGIDTTTIKELEDRLKIQVDQLEVSNNKIESELVTITQAQSVCTDAKTSSANSAAEAKQYRDQASEIAGLDDVAGAMGLLSKVYGVHDLDIPFNDGIGVTHGFGPVSFSRLSEATDINKSGQIQTFAADEPAITSKGCAFFGKVTNHVTNWNEVAWSEATTTPTPQNRLIERDVALTPDGKMEADRVTASQDLDQQRVFFVAGTPLGNGDSWSVTVKADISDRVQIRTTSSDGLIVSLADGSVINDSVDGNYEIETLIDNWFRITIFGDIIPTSPAVGWVQLLDSNNNHTFDGSTEPASVLVCNVQRSDGAFVPPPVPTSGTAVTREGGITTAPQIGNLPRPGDPFYIVVDVDAVGEAFQTILGKIYGTACSLSLTSTSQLRLTLPDGQGSTRLVNSSLVNLRKKRVIAAYQNENVTFYVDGVPSGSGVMPSKFDTFDYSGDMYIGRLNPSGQYAYPMNGYMKNLKIKHGVMTDDLAKAYGKWGD